MVKIVKKYDTYSIITLIQIVGIDNSVAKTSPIASNRAFAVDNPSGT